MNEVREIERLARLSYGRLVAKLAARTGSITDAEDALGNALLRALQLWPSAGAPPNPEAWLLRTAGNRSVDQIRTASLPTKYAMELKMLSESNTVKPEVSIDPRIGLMHACAHPAIEPRIRAPLMLQTVLGLDVKRMASVYLVSPGTLGQRLTRAKKKIEGAGIPLILPDSLEDQAERLDDILAAIYAAYAVGKDGVGADDEKASAMASEALWLVSTVCEAFPESAEAHGLFALILFVEARSPARMDKITGQLVPLQEQDTALWVAEYLVDAELAMRNAQANLSLGRFQLEAAIQAVHAARRYTAQTDWSELQKLYRGLVHISPTLGALTGQAAVEAEVAGPAQGLALLDQIETHGQGYQPWHATRAHLLAREGRNAEAHNAFGKAIGLSNDSAARAYLGSMRARLLS